MSEEHRKEIESLRAQLDQVDDRILQALSERGVLAKKVSAVRQLDPTHKGTVPAAKREREIIERIEAKGAGDFPKRALAPVFREILSACRALEAPLRVAYDGPPGSIAHDAARKRFGASAEYFPCEGPRSTLDLVEREHADLAVIVLESSTEGLLQPALDALAECELKIVDEIENDAKIHVLNKSGVLGEIETIYAAPAERASSARFLATNMPRAKILDAHSATRAAELAAADPGAAALGSATVAEMAGLEVARGNIADVLGEHVRCAILSSRPAQRSGRDTTAFVITLDDAPGALFRVLKPLADKDLNLRRIQSRPRPRGDQEGSRSYRFFIEVAGHVTDRSLVTALDEVKRTVRQLKIIGSYPSKS